MQSNLDTAPSDAKDEGREVAFMPTLGIQAVGQVKRAEIEFGDLTVLVGPQATGKSVLLQLLKLVVDTGNVQAELRRHGLEWSGKLPELFDIYFGEGMRGIWRHDSRVHWRGRPVEFPRVAGRARKAVEEQLFFIPAQRVIAMRDGWPRPFTDYTAGDPFTVREFSEKLRLLMEMEFLKGDSLFPVERRLKAAYRNLLKEHVFGDFELKVDRSRLQKRLVLGARTGDLPFMVWSAGQREFIPLLLGLYWLMPPGKTPRRGALQWVVIEEPEMGLHTRAIAVVLLLVLELLHRGYRVCLSTHSPQVLELVWALNHLRRQGEPEDLGALFGVPKSAALQSLFEDIWRKTSRVYCFDRLSGCVRDISSLDPDSAEVGEAGWGGLSEFSGRANEIVARVTARSRRGGQP